MNVSQHPVAVQRVPRKDRAETMAYGAVSSVAPDQPLRGHVFFAPVGVPQHGSDAIVAAIEGREFHLTLDDNAQITKPLLKQPFGLGLREHQRVTDRGFARSPS